MRIITISTLGKRGRFGNQMFQYAFARAYAEKYNCILQTPKWIGQDIFEIQDPLITNKLPQVNCEREYPNGRINIDLLGYFQNYRSLSIMTKTWLKIFIK